jgi:hypothetical protein
MLRWLLLATLFAIPLMFSPAAHAEGLSCGMYLDAESGARLEVIDSERARMLRDETAPSSQLYRRDGLTLRMFDIDEGYSSDDYTASSDGRTLTGNDVTFRKTFVLQQAAACAKTQPAAAADSCRADLDTLHRQDRRRHARRIEGRLRRWPGLRLRALDRQRKA